ncbi:MAG: DUF2934 domain-containing protein [bacterium]
MAATTRKPTASARRSSAKKTTTRRSAANQTNGPTTRKFAPTEDEIRRRAFEIFLSRNGQPGHDLEDWLQAEKELRAAN